VGSGGWSVGVGVEVRGEVGVGMRVGVGGGEGVGGLRTRMRRREVVRAWVLFRRSVIRDGWGLLTGVGSRSSIRSSSGDQGIGRTQYKGQVGCHSQH